MIFCLLLIIPNTVSADKVINRVDNENLNMFQGQVAYKTKDKTASNDITWRTEGFTLKNTWVDRTNPDTSFEDIDPTQKPKGSIMFEDLGKECKVSIPYPNGYTITTFTIPSDSIEAAYKNADVDTESLEANGGNIYLNGIFRVYNDGSLATTTYYKTLYKIKNAKGWEDKSDFLDHFNIEIPFEPKSYPVYIKRMTYIDGQYKTFDFSKIGEYSALSKYKTTTSQISAKLYDIVSDPSKNLYLYGTYWSALNDEKVVHENGTYRKRRDVQKISSTINPLKDWDSYRLALHNPEIRDRTYKVVNGGIEIICLYRYFDGPIPGEGENIQEISAEIIEPYTMETIQADKRFGEQFNSEKGIPTTESQYLCAYTDEYLLQYKFVHYSGWKEFPQTSGNEIVLVKRSYSYWKIEDLNVYSISYARASNYSLPGGTAYLTPTSYYSAPKVNYQISSSNLIEPTSMTINGVTTVGNFTVWNDSLTFNGETIMNNTRCSATTSTPKKMPTSGRANAYALYQSGLKIDDTKANGEYGSEGILCYTRTTHYGDDAEGNMIAYDVDDINDVTIHTPVICDAKVEDVRKYNQLIHPSQSFASLVLDTYFNVSLPTKGHHLDLKGYGNRDYAKYTALREVKFPFDVMKNGKYIAAGTWTTIGDAAQCYLPVWVKEGQYTVEFRSRSINCDANAGISKTEDLANTDFENYVATDTVDVEVSGKVYNLNLYDVSDYPPWQNVFRYSNSLEFNGTNYTVGTKDRNGNAALNWTKTAYRNAKYTLPLMSGSHPTYSTIGAVKTGYYTRFSVDTIGNYDGVDDYIRITPKFYFVNGKGKNRQEVDLYYTERFESTNKKHNLVKVGSTLDQTNIHKLNRRDPYLTGNGYLKGVTCTDETQKNVYTFGNIMIPDTLMSYTGSGQFFTPQVKTYSGTLQNLQEKSVQSWICEYYLPSTLYVCPKGYDVDEYAKEHGGIDYSEDFWLTMGYIIVNFEIETIQNGERHLSYINASNAANGYCNMWKLEGAATTKSDAYGNIFNFVNGDYALYYASANKSVKKDYQAGGIY